jgi:hypothetical protein
MKVGRKPASRTGGVDIADSKAAAVRVRRAEAPAGKRTRRPVESPARPARTRTRPQEPRGQRQGPQTAPAARPVQRPVRPKSTSQAKARAKARKAKAPKVIRTPLRERVLARLAKIDLSPRTLLAATIHRAGRPDESFTALNEVTVARGEIGRASCRERV